MYDNFGSLLFSFMMNTALIAGVPLAAATLIGVIISFFQAVTQIQDQTLAQTIKIVAIAIIFLSFSSFLLGPYVENTRWVFSNFGEL